MQKFSNDHGGKAPSYFNELRDYFPTFGGRRMTGLATFEFIRQQGPKSGDLLVLREQGSRNDAGTLKKVYGFSDGTATEVTFPDDDQHQPEQDFETWEGQHRTPQPGTEN